MKRTRTRRSIKLVFDSTADGSIQQFKTGAVRRWVSTALTHLIPTEGILAIGERFHLGAVVRGYGPWNWSKGIDFATMIQHMQTHLSDFGAQISGGQIRPECTDTPRQNLSAVAWGAVCCIHFLAFGNKGESEQSFWFFSREERMKFYPRRNPDTGKQEN